VLVGRAALHRLCRARELLASPAHDARTVRDVADAVGLSPFHFIRQFAAVFGATPHQFRTGERLARARVLLGGGARVTDACFAVGFASVGSFSALFARRVGTSPSAYRRRALVAVPAAIAPHDCYGMLAQLPAAAFRNSGEARAAIARDARPR
jgi:AraC-like DNA-binding protein